MSLKAELDIWASALKAYDEEDFQKSMDLFLRIADSSKILTNMGLIYATIGEHEAAVERFVQATNLDQYLAVAYFQCGVSNFLLARYELALKDFEEAYVHLRGNQDINYEQLGLHFRLFSAEVLFNKGLSMIYLGRMEAGLADMGVAQQEKATDEHNVIDDAIRDRGDGYTVFSIPVGVLYRPSEKKLKNSMTKDYMGKAKLVAASDPSDTFTTFTGSTRLKQGITPTGVYIDRPDLDTVTANLSRSLTAPAASSTPNVEGNPRLSRPQRSNTTLHVPSNARELTSREGISPRLPEEQPLSRSNTTIKLANSSPPVRGVVRGLSLRKPSGVSPTAHSVPPVPSVLPVKESDDRLTEFYDDYIDSYGVDLNQPLPYLRSAGGQGVVPPDRLATRGPNLSRSVSRSGPRSAPAINHAPSTLGSVGGSIRRRGTKRTANRTPGNIQSAYEDEEGYASGDYDDAIFELAKIRVKLHYQDDVRGMTLTSDIPFEEFVEKITSKFGRPFDGLSLKFMYEDGAKVTLRDESDYELAIETARDASKGQTEGKLEIWCVDR